MGNADKQGSIESFELIGGRHQACKEYANWMLISRDTINPHLGCSAQNSSPLFSVIYLFVLQIKDSEPQLALQTTEVTNLVH